ncbi:MAG TPA: MATE family efflux transporter [Planctomycetota bacterium]|nr:MATE family efflux transporter [Planctomycetota bacterium]
MTVRISSRNIWTASLPLILAGLGETLADVTDTIFLSRYGVTEVGAVAIADSVHELLFVLAVGLGEALQIVVARRAGERRSHRVGQAVAQSALLFMAAALLAFPLLRWVAPAFTDQALASGEVGAAAGDFLRVISWGVLFDAANILWIAFYIGIGRTRAIAGAIAIMTATNILLDWGLIFGHLGLPRLGIEGAAWSAVISDAAACLFFVAHAWRRGDLVAYGLLRRAPWNPMLAGRLFVLGWPVAAEKLLHAARWFAFFLIVEQLGAAPLAVSNMVHALYVLLLIPIEGFSETTCTLVSHALGARRPEDVRVVLRRAIGLGYVVLAPFLAACVLWPGPVLELFADDVALLPGAAASLSALLLAMLVAVPGEMLVSAVVGTGDTRGALGIEAVVTLFTLLYIVAAALLLHWPLHVVWLVVAAGWCLRVALAVARLRSGRWVDARV